MRYSRRYIVMTGLVLLAVFLKFNSFFADFGRIDAIGNADIDAGLWYENVASDLKESGISLFLDEKEALSSDAGIYMDENLNLMLPVDDVQDLFECSARIYDHKSLMVMKYEDCLETGLDEAEATLNGESYDMGSGLAKVGNNYYVSVAQLANALGYSYFWNAGDHCIELTNQKSGISILPSKLDLRSIARSSEVKNQGNYGTCWAFAALSSLESTLMPEESLIFSPDHMSIRNSFSMRQETGGTYTMSMAYLAAWQGPVTEAEDPYGDGKSPEGLSPCLHVQEMQLLPEKNIEEIKRFIFLYGGVQCAFYNDLSNAFDNSPYFDKVNCAYYYDGDKEANHQLVIVGWDDSYPKESFVKIPEGDGAFICQNSWGEHFGENGFFYVSYYDTVLGKDTLAFTRIEAADNYDRIYQSDLCGWVGQIGYGDEYVFGANVYTAESDEEVAAVGFYATGSNTEYEVYLVNAFTGAEDLSKKGMPLAAGKFENVGYYTVKLNQAVPVQEGEKFAVVVLLKTEGGSYPMAVEYKAGDLTRSVTLKDGEGYISRNGIKWDSTEETYECNLCLKAYTQRR